MTKVPLILLVFSMLMGLMGLSTVQNVDPEWDENTHYLIFENNPTRDFSPLFHRVVRLSAPMTSSSTPELRYALSSAQRNYQLVVVHLKDQAGKVLYQGVVQMPSVLRGEFHGKSSDDTIDGHFFPLESSLFVVRVPVIKDAFLHIWDPQTRNTQMFDLASIPISELDDSIRDVNVQMAVNSGNPQNRIDILVMGDGYTAAEKAQFDVDVDNIMSSFFEISPLAEYKNYFNVQTLFVGSNESGADHPPYDPNCEFWDNSCCADPLMQTDPLRGRMVDTAFDSTYCVYNIHQLLVSDNNKVYSAASAVPDWDIIMVIVNDPTYGGSGGSYFVVSTHSLAVDVAQHEFGHSFANLADEYSYVYPGYPECSDVLGTSPCEDNVTDETMPNKIKWAPWFLPSTPIPTVPEWDPNYESVVGLFEGARYKSSGMFRSGQDCMMRSLGRPFCQVPSQAIVLRYYNGGWGIPAEGISMIEPNSTIPSNNSVEMQAGSTLAFSADILSPILGPPPSIEWYVNGTLVLEGNDSFLFTPALGDLGFNNIRLKVMDLTPLVMPEMAGGALSFVHEWTVEVVSGVSPTPIPLGDNPIFLPLIVN